jgi:hypothetical protein
MRVVTVLMGTVFLFGAAVQYNDPDLLRWVLIYLVSAALSFGAFRRSLPWWLPAVNGGVAFLWALVIELDVDASVLPQIFGEFGMASFEIEEAREALGLVIIGVWMSVLAGMGWKRGK